MQIYYTSRPTESKSFLKKIFEGVYGFTPAIAVNENGKPYLTNSELFFNLSHSQNVTALAVHERAVGLDLEFVESREHRAIEKRLTERERREDFYTLWTAKEAYVKYRGETLASLFRSLEYSGGKLYLDGKMLPVCLFHTTLLGCKLALCTADPVHAALVCCD